MFDIKMIAKDSPQICSFPFSYGTIASQNPADDRLGFTRRISPASGTYGQPCLLVLLNFVVFVSSTLLLLFFFFLLLLLLLLLVFSFFFVFLLLLWKYD